MERRFINAIYDLESGETFINSPEKEGVWVKPGHYQELLQEATDAPQARKKTTCKYYTQERCTGYTWNPKTKTYEGFGCVTEKICECEETP